MYVQQLYKLISKYKTQNLYAVLHVLYGLEC
jgi:hypothetical protein